MVTENNVLETDHDIVRGGGVGRAEKKDIVLNDKITKKISMAILFQQ